MIMGVNRISLIGLFLCVFLLGSTNVFASEDNYNYYRTEWRERILRLPKVKELIRYAELNRAGNFLKIQKLEKIVPHGIALNMIFRNGLGHCDLIIIVSSNLTRVMAIRRTEFGDPKFDCYLDN